ncbi:IS66 family insertion sequence element accessory protein TnpB [Bradyrhizobium sp. CCBAU 65884]|uniref:IS66 family insertion sequence element accessory protein TnpB n=1 Tax=Bradyrhizobium sp. CCBAU 65884 TaxID=722477 RepID=UPI003FA4391D
MRRVWRCWRRRRWANGLAVVFRAKRADRVKIVWDGSGLVVYWKRLDGGVFKCPGGP